VADHRHDRHASGECESEGQNEENLLHDRLPSLMAVCQNRPEAPVTGITVRGFFPRRPVLWTPTAMIRGDGLSVGVDVKVGSETMSALAPKADMGTQPRNVRFVPKADSCTAAIGGRNGACRMWLAECGLQNVAYDHADMVGWPKWRLREDGRPGHQLAKPGPCKLVRLACFNKTRRGTGRSATHPVGLNLVESHQEIACTPNV
jgi:hypothetical protein